MSDKFFVDTNLLVYAYDRSAGAKHGAALELVRNISDSGAPVISTQVLQELAVCLRRKVARPLDSKEIRKIHRASRVGSLREQWRLGIACTRN
jgi:predicted nucleic acid-binding protein